MKLFHKERDSSVDFKIEISPYGLKATIEVGYVGDNRCYSTASIDLSIAQIGDLLGIMMETDDE